MRKYYQIAIDGPAGVGKSTIAKLIAKKLGFLYIDSGAMYRAITLYLAKKKMINEQESKIKEYLKRIQLSFINKKHKQIVLINNKDVTKEIRTNLVNKFVSKISSMKVVRNEMVKQQKEFALRESVVMDGRDIGTNVFKQANLKIYLTASCYVRAKRRLKDLVRINQWVHFKELVKQIQERDNYDSTRRLSPLCKSQDAIVIDSSNLTVNEVLEQINVFLPVSL